MDSLHEPVNTLARIWWWPPEDGSLYDPKHVGAKWILHDFNVFFNKYVHELVTVDKGILHNTAGTSRHISDFQVRKAGSSMLPHTGDTDTSFLAFVDASRMIWETVTPIRNFGSKIKQCCTHFFYFCSKTNQMHNNSNLFYFGTTLYMFWTVFSSIISSLRLYIKHQVYVIQVLWLLVSKQPQKPSDIYLMLYVQS